MNQAVFLDKDGTIVQDVPYNVDPARIRLLPGCVEALQRLQRAGYDLIVISNQAGLAKGLFSRKDLETAERYLTALLASSSIAISAFYYCPHLPGAARAEYARACDCRKPKPGLVLQAARDHNIDLLHSWFIGDILNDVEAGRRAGCRTILINNGNETEWKLSSIRAPHHIVRDLQEAADIICRQGPRAAR